VAAKEFDMTPAPANRRASSRPRPELADARRAGLRNIGEAAEASGLSAKMIRHYESIGLLPAATRSFAGYRLYDESDVHRLRFIRRGRRLGFSIDEIRQLLGLWGSGTRTSAEVKRLALAHVAELQARIEEFAAMKRTLEELASHCHGDHRPDCPILDDLAGGDAGGSGAATPAARNR
jgi:MerR family copper efflux transcriptional regulator